MTPFFAFLLLTPYPCMYVLASTEEYVYPISRQIQTQKHTQEYHGVKAMKRRRRCRPLVPVMHTTISSTDSTHKTPAH